MPKIPILLLAAGASTRMGQPKQLLPWGPVTLIEHQVQTLLKTGHPVHVVLGSNSNLTMPLISKYEVEIVINPHWKSGMGSSISLGISQIIQKLPDAKGVLITLLDQPMVTTSYFGQILEAFQPGLQQIIVSHSASGWTGVPGIFDQCYFKELTGLKDDQGAKQITRRYPENIILLEGGELLDDMDNMATYQQLLERYGNNG